MDYILHFNKELVTWERHRSYNLLFIKHVELYIHERLKADVFTTVNDVLYSLGFKGSEETNMVLNKRDVVSLEVNSKGTNPNVIIKLHVEKAQL